MQKPRMGRGHRSRHDNVRRQLIIRAQEKLVNSAVVASGAIPFAEVVVALGSR